jgi:hypothetical protein
LCSDVIIFLMLRFSMGLFAILLDEVVIQIFWMILNRLFTLLNCDSSLNILDIRMYMRCDIFTVCSLPFYFFNSVCERQATFYSREVQPIQFPFLVSLFWVQFKKFFQAKIREIFLFSFRNVIELAFTLKSKIY